MDSKTKNLLINLADKYETFSFTNGDPSCFLRIFKNDLKKTEVLAFVAAMLSFGRREQFLKKIEIIKENIDLLLAGKKLEQILNANFLSEKFNPDTKFYRFYSFNDVNLIFERINCILKKSETLGNHFQKAYKKQNKALYEIISEEFSGCKMISSGKNSAHKRLNMFLRWMVRQNSCVDLGIWNWYPEEKLLLPLDTHVLTQAKVLQLIDEKSRANLKTTKLLTELMNNVFPGDPVRADYALFGLGIEESKKLHT
jgi:uncharacterized protein (TIGR02757 family)